MSEGFTSGIHSADLEKHPLIEFDVRFIILPDDQAHLRKDIFLVHSGTHLRQPQTKVFENVYVGIRD